MTLMLLQKLMLAPFVKLYCFYRKMELQKIKAPMTTKRFLYHLERLALWLTGRAMHEK